ncbi:quinoprotein relay system zinc metallohydrolase 2 [Paracoccus spongiarum]|uniref:Quinoprotein relay system zinc metallohydrolase 2 n=1 Tax=Paracoccus spongiarum TaxID=3064387 RepID=A0ABT9JG02_9RHOB|nr:quinoprotein relay system zinc metallohydrolase 2 [Paracoccus sp. 2205BS29-5]MDP5308743.1 quinoprotein relay system zinc metallohydrolase 2 [Paracoccus sp. 2205BS29-5]
MPILLPRGERRDAASCARDAPRIAQDWIAGRPGLVAQAARCHPVEELPALPMRQIAPGVHVHLGAPVQLEDSADGRIANLAVVIGERSVAVIDAGVSRAQGQELFAAIRRLTDLPISHLILTHMHPDHALGASVLQEAGAELVSHAALPLALQMRADSYLGNLGRLYPPSEMLATEVVMPDTALSGPARIDLGGRVLELRPAPVAHTDNDLSVFDAASGTLFAGDLVFRDLTPIVDGSLRGWMDWMDLPPDPEPRVVVPGHGPVASGWAEAITPQQRFLKALAEAATAAIGAGLPMSEAVPVIVNDLADMENIWNSFPESVARDATAAYKELEWE